MNFSTTISEPGGHPRRFVLGLLGGAAGLLLAAGALNYWVDPYNHFGNNRLGVFISAEREAKPELMRRYPHDALLIGNSKATMIPASRLTGYRFFNAAFAGATLEEDYYCLEHFAAHQKLVVLEADYLQGDPPTNQGDIFAPAGFSAALDFLLSAKTVEYSVRTITEHFAGTPSSILPDGSSEASGWFRLYDREDKAARQWQLARLAAYFARTPALPATCYYRKIAALLQQRQTPCVVFVPPLPQELLDRLKTDARQRIFNRWMAELRKSFAHVIDLSSGPYSEAGNFFKTDPYHFKPDAGVRLMNEKVIPLALPAAAADRALP